ncbi:MAG: DUF4293 domain-containing protein [Bacteroidota bacterium]|nr:DUF4293 domain-containing protein [Bacteroidota bacterium]
MIQRIQTIFLFLYIAALISTFFFPVWQKISFNDQTNEVDVIVTGHVSSVIYDKAGEAIIYDNFWVGGFIIIACIVAAMSIFSFKNRLTQIKLGTLNSLFTSLLVIYYLYEIFYNIDYVDIKDKISFLISFYLIFLAIFFNFLANRFIRKDELLVRESERIR